ncbi:MAG: hypothetical protein ACO3CL_08410 [Bacteroidia bacterium]
MMENPVFTIPERKKEREKGSGKCNNPSHLGLAWQQQEFRLAGMIETLLQNYYRTFLLVIGILAAIFVWPTLYKTTISADHRQDNGHIDVFLFRENRITGKVETYVWMKQRWEIWHKDVYRAPRENAVATGSVDSGKARDGSALAGEASREVLEKGTRSLHANLPTEVIFENRSGQTVRIYWLDYSGNRKLYRTLENGQKHAQKTFVTHPWLITGEDDRGWQVFFPDSLPRTVVISAPANKS